MNGKGMFKRLALGLSYFLLVLLVLYVIGTLFLGGQLLSSKQEFYDVSGFADQYWFYLFLLRLSVLFGLLAYINRHSKIKQLENESYDRVKSMKVQMYIALGLVYVSNEILIYLGRVHV